MIIISWVQRESSPGRRCLAHAVERLNKGRSALGLTQVRGREGYDNDITFYKFFHASSSSGLSQSLDREDSLIVAISSFSRTTFAFRKWTKSRTSGRRESGTSSISFISNSFVFMALIPRHLNSWIFSFKPSSSTRQSQGNEGHHLLLHF